MEKLTIQEIFDHCKRKTEMYEKCVPADYFNVTSMTNSAKEYWEHKQVAEYLEEMMKYRELEEQGRLLKLPCKIGQKVYIPRCIEECKYDFECPFEDIEERSRCANDEPCENAYKVYKIVEPAFELKMLAKIGTRIFITREEAEAKLNEMKGE